LMPAVSLALGPSVTVDLGASIKPLTSPSK
jgi:hypothetical protein